MDAQIIIDCNIPGVKPAHQRRSRELMVSLVNEGLALLGDHDFDTLSIETICERCNTTTGSFYARFESKEVFVTALQRLVVADTRTKMVAQLSVQSHRPRIPALSAGLDQQGGVMWYRRNEGLVRACLRRAGSDPGIWTPIRNSESCR